MSDILIKGMKMPKCCKDCVLFHADSSGFYGCFAEMQIILFDERETKPDWCPLIKVHTPHGRLIDADAYHKEIRERYQSAKEWYKEAEDDEIIGRAEATMITFTECSLTLQHMPTIIEAEGI